MSHPEFFLYEKFGIFYGDTPFRPPIIAYWDALFLFLHKYAIHTKSIDININENRILVGVYP